VRCLTGAASGAGCEGGEGANQARRLGRREPRWGGKKAASDYRVLRKCVARVFAERLETAVQEVAHVVGEVCVDHLRKIECMLIDKLRRNSYTMPAVTKASRRRHS
jgi:hypothetical protein